MITHQPCGCSTKPVNRKYKIKDRLLAGDAIWFDDPKCSEHEKGTKIHGYMIYSNGIVYCNILDSLLPNITPGTQEFELPAALDWIERFYKSEFDFSYGKAGVEKENGKVSIVCKGA